MRLISKIDIKNNYVIKSIMYDGVKKIGDPIEICNKLYTSNVDEFFITNFVDTLYQFSDINRILSYLSKNFFLPITVGGGIQSIKELDNLFKNGADKISLNSALFEDTNLLKEAVTHYGSQSISVTIQAKQVDNAWYAFKNMARENSNFLVSDWMNKCQDLGAGEIILINVERDGTQRGFDLDLIDSICDVNVPLVVSGGIVNFNDIENIVQKKIINGISINSAIYNNLLKISDVKDKLKELLK